jgi:thioredoxin reductase
MATPDILPLRSDMSFARASASTSSSLGREVGGQGVNVRYGRRSPRSQARRAPSRVALRSGETIEAENVVLAIGVQGDLRKLDVPGDNLPFVQYQLDDPDAYANETIVVVGASESAIENAVALSKQNQVALVQPRRRLRPRQDGQRQPDHEGHQERPDSSASTHEGGAGRAGRLHLKTPRGSGLPCNRVIARLGGILPTAFLKDCGIKVAEGSGPTFPRSASSTRRTSRASTPSAPSWATR